MTDVPPPYVVAVAPEAERPPRFRVDALGDGAYLAGTLALDAVSGVLLTTGEIRPQQIAPNFGPANLLPIDRPAARETVDPSAGPLSNAGLIAAVGFAALDPVATALRDGGTSGLVDGVLYAESLSTTLGVTNLVKVAVRRPRPVAYIARSQALAAGASPLTYDNASTDSSLSFFSGHAATVASLSATATYLAFARSPHASRSPRPWLTLAGGAALTTFVGVERVRAGAHFPTDVITGALAGAAIGVLVPHVHRLRDASDAPVLLGVSGAAGRAEVSLSGSF